MNSNIQHIAIILDGNRRWAKERGLDVNSGYSSVKTNKFIEYLDFLSKKKIKYFSVWAFSTENWKRKRRERKEIFKKIDEMLDEISNLNKNNFIFRWIGRRDRINDFLKNKIEKLEGLTKKNKGISFQLCLDYGGRDEIIRAINKLLKENKKKISVEEFKYYLDTKDIPDPDLIIRTGGDLRLSGFMIYQSAYTELYFTKKYFPDFNINDLEKALKEFSKRQRRFGVK